MYKIIRNFLNGLALGITETVPGVSGGTIAVIMGFYGEFIEAVNHFKKQKKQSLKFLVPLLLGIIAGLLSFGSLVQYLLTDHSFPTMLFFMGLIVGIIPPIYSKLKKRQPKFILKKLWLVLVPVLALVLLSNLKEASFENPAEVIGKMGAPFMLFVFFAGIFAAAALVVPGVSGSVVLIIMEVYPLVIYCLSKIGSLMADITNVALLLDICKLFVPLGLGLVIGALSMLRLIEKLLKNHYESVYSVVLGLLSGSAYVLINDPIVFGSYIDSADAAKWSILVFFRGDVQISPLIVAAGMLTFALGAVLSFFSGKNAFKTQKEKQIT